MKFVLFSAILQVGFGVFSAPAWTPMVLNDVIDALDSFAYENSLPSFSYSRKIDIFSTPRHSDVFESLPVDLIDIPTEYFSDFYVTIAYIPEGSEQYNNNMPAAWVDGQVFSLSLVSKEVPITPAQTQVFWFVFAAIFSDISNRFEIEWQNWNFNNEDFKELRNRFSVKVGFTIYDILVGQNEYGEFEVRIDLTNPREIRREESTSTGGCFG